MSIAIKVAAYIAAIFGVTLLFSFIEHKRFGHTTLREDAIGRLWWRGGIVFGLVMCALWLWLQVLEDSE